MNLRTAALGCQENEIYPLVQALGLFHISVTRHYPYYPDEGEIQRLLRAVDPDILFISTSAPARMAAAIEQTLQVLPHQQIVLVDSGAAEPDTLRRAMQLGVRECISFPLAYEELQGTLERAIARRRSQASRTPGTNCLYSFLPARPGVGATTLATQIAQALPTAANHRSLLLDGDLDAGMVHFLTKANNPHSIIDAMDRVAQLDEHLWPQLVTDRGDLDVLQAGDSNEDYRPDLGQLQHVLEFARRQYASIIVDLPAAINRISTELMQQSKEIFLVTTTEVASLHMARKRWLALKDLHLKDQVRLLVNRVGKNDGSGMSRVADTVGLPVHATFANDYVEVQKAVLNGSQVSESRLLGKQIREFARSLTSDETPTPAPRKRRYLEMFTLTRHSEARWGDG